MRAKVTKEYDLMAQCVAEGVDLGLTRVDKIREGLQDRRATIAVIHDAVMHIISERFDFDEGSELTEILEAWLRKDDTP